ncbi:MAG TPA: DNA cytosine methyltransferase [Pirellulales bacterium]|jgi:DNA (cytosine-5)-methyltransferase 1|nr:DNA cytosine methyltransferase [Pirellulales bacterium]
MGRKSLEIIGIDLFAGAGGMSLGARLAGVKVALAVELDQYAAQTYSANHKCTKVVNCDIRKLTAPTIREFLDAKSQTVVFGGPPCQGFSYSNQRTRSPDNPENWLFLEFLRVVRVVKPDWVVFENVKGIVDTANGVFLEQVVDQLECLGYTNQLGLLNAMHFGVPQNRARFFLVGSRHGVKFKMPTLSHNKPLTVRDAIDDLPRLENGATISRQPYRRSPSSQYAKQLRQRLKTSSNHLVSNNAPVVIKRYEHIPPGGNWESIPARLMRNYRDRSRCHTGIYYRLKPDEPSVVIGNYRKNMLIHPAQHRGLSVREAARIQSFPDSYEFHGSIGFQQQQVGNAVPPLLARAVFSSLLAHER